jgi:outer membrane protein TolC
MESTKALFYPNINLRGFAGFSSIGFGDFLAAGSRQPGLGIAISLPIFDADRLRNQYRAVTAQTDSAIASYNKTLINAFRDVADQLSTLQSLEKQLQRQRAALDSAQESLTLAQQRYRSGITGALPVLNTEANVLNQQRGLTDLQARWIDSRIKLIHALGGGFVEPQHTQHSSNESGSNPGVNHG